MADPSTDGQQDQGQQQDPQQTQQQPATGQQQAHQQEPSSSDDGKGGKDAILADLAKERDKRQSLEQQVNDLQSAQQQQLDSIAKALGLKTDEPPDPAKLTEQLTTEQRNAREAQVQLAVYRSARDSGGDPDALLDSASFLRSLTDVDPADSEAVGKAIKEAVAANPRLGIPEDGKRRTPRPDPTQGRPAGQSLDPRSADLAQIEADLAAGRRR